MIQVLIVDDEIHCAQGVRQAIDWLTIGVDNVFTAYSMQQAQKLMEKEEIHIIISDVEMPKGSGFDLLHWIADSEHQPVVIMLTSYATFEYAKLAIAYQCLDYLLKPVSRDALLDVGRRAVDAVMQERRKKEDNQLAGYWNDNERSRIRHFWKEILEQQTFPDSQSILERARQSHIIFDEYNLYLPILYKLHLPEGAIYQQDSLDAFIKMLREQIFDDENQVVMIQNELFILAIAGYAADFNVYYEKFRSGNRSFIDMAAVKMQIKISAYIGEFKASGQVAIQYAELLSMDKDNVIERPGLYFLNQQPFKIVYERPDIEKWIRDFSDENYDMTIFEIEKYVDQLAYERRVNQESLTQLMQDFMQAFYIIVGEKEVQAHLLFEDEISLKLYQKACKSVKDFKVWIRHIINKSGGYISMMTSDADSVIKHIKRFIKEHFCEELSRNQIAAEVCMSPDYVSRIFRQETGIQLSEYITATRMEAARHLLITTTLPVGEVAFKVGYYNIAYFSRVFRIRNNKTPAEYRSDYKRNNE